MLPMLPGTRARRHGIILRKHYVSCICRAVYGSHDRTGSERDYHEPIPNPEGSDAQSLFNDPDNHWADFSYGDMIL